MAIFESILGGGLFSDFWKQVQAYVFSGDRLKQLFTLQPIEIYEADTELEIDTAKVRLSINSKLENLVQRRIERTINFLTLNFDENHKDLASYNFDVNIKAYMAYPDIDKFFNHHFGNQTFPIEENKYYLHIEKFMFSSEGEKAMVHLPFILESKRWFWKRKMHGVACLKGFLNYHQPKDVIKVSHLQYELESANFVLNTIDHIYHEQIIQFLTDFLQYNFEEDLFHAKTEAQEEINKFQEESDWIHGVINELELENIVLQPLGVRGTFFAKGKLHLIR